MPDQARFDAQLRADGLAFSGALDEPISDLELAARLHQTLPASAPRFRLLRAEALRVLVVSAPAPTPELLGAYGLELLGVGEREAAARELARAVELARAGLDTPDARDADARDADDHTAAPTATLARALDAHGCALRALGEHARAGARSAEAVALLEPLVAAPAEDPAPASLRVELARAFNNRSNALSELGERVHAYAAVERSVALYRELAEQDPHHRGALAAVLSNLGASLSELGNDRGAVEATEEAVALLRELASEQGEAAAGEANKEADMSELARAQHNLASYALDSGDHTQGHAVALEAAASYRALVEQLPQAFCADLVDTLDTLARALILRELEPELIAVMREANAAHERLDGLDPPAAAQRLPAYAKRCLKLCARLNTLGQAAAAVEQAERAIDAYRTLVDGDPSYRTKLAAALQHLSVNLSLVERHDDALAASRETVAQWRALTSEDPERFTTKLIAALENLGQDLETLERTAEAVEVAAEVIALLEPLAAADPAEHGPALVSSLANLALDLDGLERHEDALRLASEAVDHARPLASDDPDSYEPELAHALDVCGSIQCGLGRYDAAYASYREGLRRLAPHYAIEPQDYEPLREELLGDLRELCERSGLPWPAQT